LIVCSQYGGGYVPIEAVDGNGKSVIDELITFDNSITSIR